MILFLISIVLIFAFAGYSFIGYGLIPEESAVVTEIILYVLFLISLVRRVRGISYRLDLIGVFSFFVLAALTSVVYNNFFNFQPVYGLRLVLRFYLFYLALINLHLSEMQLKRIMGLLSFLFIIQLPVSVIKFVIQGVNENTIGTYALHGGGITPTIAVVGLVFAAAYYSLYKHSITYIILGVSFIAYGILGAKRIMLFLYPMIFFILYYILYIKQSSVLLKRGSTIAFLITFVLTMSTGAVILKYNPTLNPEKKVGGSVNFEYALDFSKKYEGNMLTRKTATGRYNTTKITFNVLAGEGVGRLIFGFGPGSLTRSILDRDFHYSSPNLKIIDQCYGQTGLTFIATEYGLLGVITIVPLFFICIFRSWRYFNQETDPYWKAFGTGCLVFSILQMFIFFAYNPTPLMNNTITPTFYCAMAILYYRFKGRDLASVTDMPAR